jgi:hypothetical protein
MHGCRCHLWTAIGHLFDLFTPAECRNYFAAKDTMQRDRPSLQCANALLHESLAGGDPRSRNAAFTYVTRSDRRAPDRGRTTTPPI